MCDCVGDDVVLRGVWFRGNGFGNEWNEVWLGMFVVCGVLVGLGEA